MKSALPKVLHPLAGAPMLIHVLDAVAALRPARTVLVLAPGMDAAADVAAPYGAAVAIQERPLGTAHAVLAARPRLRGFRGDILIVYGDTPLVRPETLRGLVRALRGRRQPALAVLGFRPADPGAYGRLILGADGSLERIVEFRDAGAAERAVTLCNAGMMAADAARLFALLPRIGNRNAKREYYLTDAVALARSRGWACAVREAAAEEVLGVDSRAALAEAEAILQRRLRAAALAAGATLIAPETVWLCRDTRLGRDVVIEPHVVFGPGVVVGDDVRIRSFCHLEGATVAAGAIVGPFARLRPGARVGTDAHVGNFVEIKAAEIEPGAKVNHLAYVGDARVGARANVGAGTITCNYDGFAKHRTEIGAGAFIGSNTALVAPVTVGNGAVVGAGSVITDDVPADALAVGRGQQHNIAGWAAANRARRAKAGKAKRK